MKTNNTLFLIFCSCFAFVSCGLQGCAKQSSFEKALKSLSKHDLHSTNGYDYSIKQYYGSEIVNSKSIQLRAKFDNGTQAKKIVKTKCLNDFGHGEQFSLTETTTFFKNNQICEFANGLWVWRTYNESEFLQTDLSSFSLNERYFINISETNLQSDLKFTADISSNYINDVLGNDADGISELKLTLVVKNDYSLIKSLSFTYNQQTTNSEISFVSIFDAGVIDFPA